jgi:hypothetical protein
MMKRLRRELDTSPSVWRGALGQDEVAHCGANGLGRHWGPDRLLGRAHRGVGAERNRRRSDVAAAVKQTVDSLPPPIQHAVSMATIAFGAADLDVLLSIEMKEHGISDRQR